MISNKTFIIARFEFLKTVKRKGFLLGTILIPLLIALPTFFVSYTPTFQKENEGKKVGLVDPADFLDESGEFLEYPNFESAKQALIGKEIPFFFVIPEDYSTTNKIIIYLSKELFSGAFSIQTIQDFLAQSWLRQAGVEEEVAQKISHPPMVEEVILDAQGQVKEGETEFDSILPFILMILLVLGILTSSGYLMEGIGEEKESRTGELLLSSASATELLKGKILGYGGASLLQIALWILFGFLLLLLRFPDVLAAIEFSFIIGLALIYFFLGYFLFSTSIACAASIASTTKEAQQTSMIFSIFAILPLMFSSILMMNPSSALNQALTYFPYTAPFITIMRFSLGEIAWYEIALSLAILILSIGILSTLSGKIFRMGMLMTGKRASFRELIGYLKEK